MICLQDSIMKNRANILHLKVGRYPIILIKKYERVQGVCLNFKVNDLSRG